MFPKHSQRRMQLLSAMLLALLLCVQTGLVAHTHAGDTSTGDCLQCQVDGSQAVLPSAGALPSIEHAAPIKQRATVLAPVASLYRPSARGPPTAS
jgi:hypothetical protein